jgi:hypothetical protein
MNNMVKPSLCKKKHRDLLICLLCMAVSVSVYCQKPYELDIPYSAENPPGPNFSAEQKQQQRIAGMQLLDDIRSAYDAGDDIFIIPPGDYRFGTAWDDSNSFVLNKMERDGLPQFRILGYGATLWFDLGPESMQSAGKVNYMVRLSDCSNVTLEGITIDSDPRGCMDARVTAFDYSGNRIQIEPLEGTKLITEVQTRANRFIPFKSNGHHIAPLYKIDDSWGPASLFYNGFTTTNDGEYWIEMDTELLLQTISDPAWLETYGPEGILEIGDVLAFVWSTSYAINLNNCKQIIVRDCKVYAAKALAYETGYGDNKWINCYFMPRPGTNNLLGGEGLVSTECMFGSLVDGMVQSRNADDPLMFRTFWRNAVSVTANSITFHKDLPKLLAPGHKAKLFDINTKACIGQLTVDSVQDNTTVIFMEPVGDFYANATVLFTDHQNASWIIRNSYYVDCYQRVPLLFCGPGLFENNRIERAGGFMHIHTGVPGSIEGGIPDGIVIRNNVFIDSPISPSIPTFLLSGEGPPISNIQIEGNLICNTGREVVDIISANDLVIKNNIIVNPFEGNALIPETDCIDLPVFRLDQIEGAAIENNIVIRRDSSKAITFQRSCSDIFENGNESRIDSQEWLEAQIMDITKLHDRNALTIIQKIRSQLVKGESSED